MRLGIYTLEEESPAVILGRLRTMNLLTTWWRDVHLALIIKGHIQGVSGWTFDVTTLLGRVMQWRTGLPTYF